MSKALLLTCIVLAAATQEALSHDAIPMAEQSLANTILRSSASMGDRPERSLDCFNLYLPKINEATNTYESEYTQCLQTAANAAEAVEAEVAVDRINVNYGADGVCTLFMDCSNKVSSSDFFECYMEAAGKAITASYEIQTVSKNKLQYISQKYQTISYDQKTCTDGCSDDYVQETAALYAALESCLAGEVIQPGTSTEYPNTTTPSDTVADSTTTTIAVPSTTEVTTTTPGSIPTPPNTE